MSFRYKSNMTRIFSLSLPKLLKAKFVNIFYDAVLLHVEVSHTWIYHMQWSLRESRPILGAK